VAGSEIATEVREFISEHISSLEQLEVLLLLHRSPEQEWTPEGVLSEIQSSDISIRQRLQELFTKGLLAQPRNNLYRYAPRSEKLSRAVDALALAYKERRIKVIETVYKKPDDIQTFADAFKIRKEKSDA
jgi:hypothetical protein